MLIVGGERLEGVVRVSGGKNTAAFFVSGGKHRGGVRLGSGKYLICYFFESNHFSKLPLILSTCPSPYMAGANMTSRKESIRESSA